jgi:hypothetical protein
MRTITEAMQWHQMLWTAHLRRLDHRPGPLTAELYPDGTGYMLHVWLDAQAHDPAKQREALDLPHLNDTSGLAVYGRMDLKLYLRLVSTSMN